MSRRIHEVAFVWLSDVGDAWFHARERHEYYPACRGTRHRVPNAGWASPNWNLRWHYKSHSVRGQGTSQYWCDECLPVKWRNAAEMMQVMGIRAMRVDAEGVPINDNKDCWGGQFICPVHGRRTNDTVTSMKTCAVPMKRNGFCGATLRRT